MEPIISLRYYWNHDSIRPGGVGSVGDTLVVPKLKKSSPDMALRFDSAFYKRQKQNGSEITREPYILNRGLGGKRGFKISHGWYYQDRRAPAKSTEPTLASTGDYSWKNKIATVVKAKVTGNKFLPLPGGYKSKEGTTPRGGNFPTVTNEVGELNSVTNNLVQPENGSVVAQNNSFRDNRSMISSGYWKIPTIKNV